MTYHLVTAAWGPAYVDLLLNLAIPTLLAPGNLPALAAASASGKSLYRLYTRRQDAQGIAESPAIAALARIMPVDIVLMDHLDTLRSSRYAPMTACHRHAIKLANDAGAAIVFLTPDAIFSDGSLAAMHRIAQTGKRAVMIAGPRLNRDTFVPAFRQRFRAGGQAVAAAPARDLIRLSLDHLHPFSRSLVWDNPDYNRLASHTYWVVPGQGLLAHCFHLHPLMVQPADTQALPNITFDGDYLRHACPHYQDMYIVQDSDEILGLEISRPDDPGLLKEIQPGGTDRLRQAQASLGRRDGASLKALALADWARRGADKHHRRFFELPIRLHAGDLGPAWPPVEAQAHRLVRQVLDWLALDKDQAFAAMFGPTPDSATPPAPPTPAAAQA